MNFLFKISKYYYLGILTWLLVFLLRKAGVIIPLINGHLTDLYSVPMFCYTIKMIINTTYDKYWNPNLRFILSSSIHLTITFEIICPLLSKTYTSDIIDVLCYFVGGGIFYYCNLPQTTSFKNIVYNLKFQKLKNK